MQSKFKEDNTNTNKKVVKIDTNKENQNIKQKPKLKKQVSISENTNLLVESLPVKEEIRKKKLSFKEQREKFEKRDSKLVKQLMNNPDMIKEVLEKTNLKKE